MWGGRAGRGGAGSGGSHEQPRHAMCGPAQAPCALSPIPLCTSQAYSMALAASSRVAPAAQARRVASARVAPSARVARRQTVSVRASGAPLVGSVAPDFKAQAVFDQEFMEVSLSKYRGKYVVLFFYPLDFT